MHLHNICEAATTDEDDEEEDTAKKDVFNNSSNLEKYNKWKEIEFRLLIYKICSLQIYQMNFYRVESGIQKEKGNKILTCLLAVGQPR